MEPLRKQKRSLQLQRAYSCKSAVCKQRHPSECDNHCILLLQGGKQLTGEM